MVLPRKILVQRTFQLFKFPYNFSTLQREKSFSCLLFSRTIVFRILPKTSKRQQVPQAIHATAHWMPLTCDRRPVSIANLQLTRRLHQLTRKIHWRSRSTLCGRSLTPYETVSTRWHPRLESLQRTRSNPSSVVIILSLRLLLLQQHSSSSTDSNAAADHCSGDSHGTTHGNATVCIHCWNCCLGGRRTLADV